MNHVILFKQLLSITQTFIKNFYHQIKQDSKPQLNFTASDGSLSLLAKIKNKFELERNAFLLMLNTPQFSDKE